MLVYQVQCSIYVSIEYKINSQKWRFPTNIFAKLFLSVYFSICVYPLVSVDNQFELNLKNSTWFLIYIVNNGLSGMHIYYKYFGIFVLTRFLGYNTFIIQVQQTLTVSLNYILYDLYIYSV